MSPDVPVDGFTRAPRQVLEGRPLPPNTLFGERDPEPYGLYLGVVIQGYSAGGNCCSVIRAKPQRMISSGVIASARIR